MVFEAVALEVLDGVFLAVGGACFGKLFRDRVAVDRQAAVGLPVVQEGPAQRMAGLCEEDAVGGGGIYGSRLKDLAAGVLVAQQPQEHGVRASLVFGVV